MHGQNCCFIMTCHCLMISLPSSSLYMLLKVPLNMLRQPPYADNSGCNLDKISFLQKFQSRKYFLFHPDDSTLDRTE